MTQYARNPQTGETFQLVDGNWQQIAPAAPSRAAEPEPEQSPSRSIPEPSGIAEELWRGAKRGFGTAVSSTGLALGDASVLSPQTAAGAFAYGQALQADNPPSAELTRQQQEVAQTKTAWDAIKGVATHPRALANTVVESGPASLPSMVGGAVGSLGGPAGLAAGVGLGSMAVEYGSNLMQALQEAGLNPYDRDQVAAALSSPGFLAKARDTAMRRGIPVGAFDAMSGGLAGRILAGRTGTIGSFLARSAGEVAMQGGLGAAGEAAAQGASGQYSPSDIIYEAAAELPSGLVETGLGVAQGEHRHVPGKPHAQPPGAPAATPPGAPPPPPAAPPASPAPAATTPLPGSATAGMTSGLGAGPLNGGAAPGNPQIASPQSAGTPMPPPSSPGSGGPSVEQQLADQAQGHADAILAQAGEWEPVWDESDPNAPVIDHWRNRRTGEARTPEQHAATIATPLSGLEPTAPAPQDVAQQVKAAEERAASPQKLETPEPSGQIADNRASASSPGQGEGSTPEPSAQVPPTFVGPRPVAPTLADPSPEPDAIPAPPEHVGNAPAPQDTAAPVLAPELAPEPAAPAPEADAAASGPISDQTPELAADTPAEPAQAEAPQGAAALEPDHRAEIEAIAKEWDAIDPAVAASIRNRPTGNAARVSRLRTLLAARKQRDADRTQLVRPAPAVPAPKRMTREERDAHAQASRRELQGLPDDELIAEGSRYPNPDSRKDVPERDVLRQEIAHDVLRDRAKALVDESVALVKDKLEGHRADEPGYAEAEAKVAALQDRADKLHALVKHGTPGWTTPRRYFENDLPRHIANVRAELANGKAKGPRKAKLERELAALLKRQQELAEQLGQEAPAAAVPDVPTQAAPAPPKWAEGDRVRITDGPNKGRLGTLTRANELTRQPLRPGAPPRTIWALTAHLDGDAKPAPVSSKQVERAPISDQPAGISDQTSALATAAAPAYGSANKVFTKEAADKARALLKKKLSGTQLNSGLDPEVMLAGLQLAGYHVEAGARSFAAYSAAMIEDLGEAARPYLRGWYENVRHYPGFDNAGMTPAAEIDVSPEATAAVAPRPEDTTGEQPEPGPQPAPATNPPAELKGEEARGAKIVEAAKAVRDVLRGKLKLTVAQLREAMQKAFGGTLAQGAYDSSDANEALEAGIALRVLATTRPGVADAAVEAKRAQHFQDKLDQLPTQTRRTEDKEAFQQFSTPPGYAFAAVYAAGLSSDDVVLEPSAGTGMLAAWAKAQPAVVASAVKAPKVYVNEIDPRRRGILKALGAFDGVFGEDAEQLDNILPDDIRPTVVIMNPPFSAAGHRGVTRDLTIGAKHIEQALKRLAPGGRLVAIVGRGMQMKAPTFVKWWNKIQAEHTVRANIGVDGEVYRKMGTSFGTRLLVIDKTGPQQGAIVGGDVKSVGDLVHLLEGIAHGRRTAADERPGSTGDQEAAGTARPEGTAGAAAGRDDAAGAGGRAGGSAGRDDDAAGGGPGHGADQAGGDRPGDRPRRGRPAAPGRRGRAEAEPAGAGAGAVGEPARPPVGGGQLPAAAEQPAPNDAVTPPQSAPVDEKPLAPQESEAPRGEDEAGIFETYRPQGRPFEAAQPHGTPLVQSAAMASVAFPKLAYKPRLDPKIAADGRLSAAQLETVAYAGQAHEGFLPGGEVRQGFFIGDGTGVGKGRQIAGIILDHFNRGGTKAVWISKNKKLIDDAVRDWTALGGAAADVVNLQKTKVGDKVKAERGVLFAPYETVKSGAQFGPGGHLIKRTMRAARIDQIKSWLPKDFDGVIAFDEAHEMGNALPMKGARGMTDASQRALAGVHLQQAFPKARIVYVSATGATEVGNLTYAERLGLWGPGTPFATAPEFVATIQAGGLAAMEIVARDLKQLGLYTARSLSMKGVQYERLEHALTPEQTAIYSRLADAWQVILRDMNAAMGKDVTNAPASVKSSAMGSFWTMQQMFFNQVMTSMQMPSVVTRIEQDLKAGHAVVLQLVNHYGGRLDAEIARHRSEQSEDGADDEFVDYDLTPKQAMIDMVKKAFPVWQFEEHVDPEDGTKSKHQVKDSQGNPVLNREAVAMRDRLIADLETIRIPNGPVDILMEQFGADKIAEVTGRNKRIVFEDGKPKLETRQADAANRAEIAAFQGDRKPILLFSQAGGTGASYHADKTAKNQRLRRHYVLQAGWRADGAIQGFGRTHRTNQAQAPEYVLTSTDLPGHRRFISSIARRIEQLGALTKGQRQAGASIFSEKDNLEGPYAAAAIHNLFDDVGAGRVDGISRDDVAGELGLERVYEEAKRGRGKNTSNMPAVTQFLNRLLSTSPERQRLWFDAFSTRMEQLIDQARAADRLDTGLQEYQANSVKLERDRTVWTDPKSGAQTKLAELTAMKPIYKRPWKDVQKDAPNGTYVNLRSGRVWVQTDVVTRTLKNGNVENVGVMVSPAGRQLVETHKLRDTALWRREGKVEEAQRLWQKDYDEAPDEVPHRLNLLTGALLPIWNRIPNYGSIYRVQVTDGPRLIGREIHADDLNETLDKLGVDRPKLELKPRQAIDAVSAGAEIELSNGWRLTPVRSAGELRIKLDGPNFYSTPALVKAGVQQETHNYHTTLYVPTGPAGERAMAAVLLGNDIKRLRPADGQTVEQLLSSVGAKFSAPAGWGDVDGGATVDTSAGSPFEGQPVGTVVSHERQAGALEDELKAIAKRIAGDAVKDLQVFRRITALSPEGAGFTPGGLNRSGLIHMALEENGRSVDRGRLGEVLRHEVIHALVDSGVIPEVAWKALKARAAGWRKAFGIDERYAKITADEAKLDEEAIADAYAAWHRGELKNAGGPAAVAGFRRIQRFLAGARDALKRLLGLKVLPSAEEVFRRIEAGEFAGAPREGGDGEARFALPNPGAGGILGGRNPVEDAARRAEQWAYPMIAGAMRVLGQGRKVGAMAQMLDRVRWGIQDAQIGMKRMQDAAGDVVQQQQQRALALAERPYDMAELAPGRAAHEKFLVEKRYVEPMLEAMHSQGIDFDRSSVTATLPSGASREVGIEDWLYARHAGERNAHIAAINPKLPDAGSGMSNADAQAILDAVQAAPAPVQQAFDRIGRLWDRMLADRVQRMSMAGLLSADDVKGTQQYRHYVPLRQVEGGPHDLDDQIMRGMTGKGLMGRKTKERAATGRFTEAQHIFAQGLVLAHESIDRAERNMVAQSLFNLAATAPDDAIWKIAPAERKAYITNVPGGGKLVRYRYQEHEGTNTVSVWIAGQRFRIAIMDKPLYEALQSMQMRDLGGLFRAVSTMTATLAKLNTMWSPEFVVSNAIMDAQTGFVHLSAEHQRGLAREVARNWMKAARGAEEWLRTGRAGSPWARHAEEFYGAGGGTAFNAMFDVMDEKKRLDRALARLNTGSGASLGRGWRAVWNSIERVNGAVDAAMRLSLYVGLRNRGYSPQKAASAAKNLTINFNRKGKFTPYLNALYSFMNASVQGTATIAKAAGRSRKVRLAIGGMIMAGAIQELLGSLGGGGDDDLDKKLGSSWYDRVPDWQLSRRIVIPWADDKGRYLAIWMPYGYNAFHNIGRALVHYARQAPNLDGTRTTLGQTAASIISGFWNAFMPSALTGGIPLVPTLTQPLVEVATNRDWLDRPIAPERYPGDKRPDSERSFPSVNPAAKAAAKLLNKATGGDAIEPGMVDLSPETLEHLIQGYSGSAGNQLAGLLSSILRAGREATGNAPEDQDLGVRDIPFLRKVWNSPSDAVLRDITYRRIGRIELLNERMKQARAPGTRDEAEVRRLQREDGPLLGLKAVATDLTSGLADLRRQRQGVLASNRSTAEKRQLTDRLDEREQAALLRFNERFERAQERASSPPS